MATDWLRECRGEEFVLDGDIVEVRFRDGRRHRIRLEEQADTLVLSAVVVGAARAVEAKADEVAVWRRNQGTRLTSFRFDQRGRIVGEAFMPLIGLTADAVSFRVRVVAEECDQFERALTGRDLE